MDDRVCKTKTALSLLIVTCIFLQSQSVNALTISSAGTIGVTQTQDPVTRSTIYTATAANANINITTIRSSLSTSNVIVKDNVGPNISIIDGTVLSWSSAYNLTINAPQNIIIGNAAQFVSNGYGNLILRADYTANNEGTIVPPRDGSIAVVANGGGNVKLYYRPIDYTKPTDFNSVIKVSEPGRAIAFMAINNFADLQDMNDNLNGNYGLATDIDATGLIFSPIGKQATPFSGQFDGQGHQIKNLRISLPNINYVGLFGYVKNAFIENISLINSNFTGSQYVGGLIGYSDSSLNVFHAFSSGTFAGQSYVGGLIGYIQGTAANPKVIDESASEGSIALISNGGIAGGLIGSLNYTSQISNCYSTVKIDGSDGSVIGGLIGYGVYMSNHNFNNYAAGSLAKISEIGGIIGQSSPLAEPVYRYVFWDKQTTGAVFGDGYFGGVIPGLNGLTTEAMHQKNSFTNWDFDFVWGIDEGKSYPYLLWTKLPAPWTSFATKNGYRYIQG